MNKWTVQLWDHHWVPSWQTPSCAKSRNSQKERTSCLSSTIALQMIHLAQCQIQKQPQNFWRHKITFIAPLILQWISRKMAGFPSSEQMLSGMAATQKPHLADGQRAFATLPWSRLHQIQMVTAEHHAKPRVSTLNYVEVLLRGM